MIIAQLALFLTFILYFFKDIYDERTKRDIYNSINRRNDIQISNGEKIYKKIIQNYNTREI